jgi:hypothetical protein
MFVYYVRKLLPFSAQKSGFFYTHCIAYLEPILTLDLLNHTDSGRMYAQRTYFFELAESKHYNKLQYSLVLSVRSCFMQRHVGLAHVQT